MLGESAAAAPVVDDMAIAPDRTAASKRAFANASYSGVMTNGWSSPSSTGAPAAKVANAMERMGDGGNVCARIPSWNG